MNRTVKYLYYRGARQVAQIVEKQASKLQNLSYRGATVFNRVKETVTHNTSGPHVYRGVAY